MAVSAPPQGLVDGQKVSTGWFNGQWTVTQLFGVLENLLGNLVPHSGIDIAPGADTTLKTPVHAVVSEAGWSGYGNTIILTLDDGTQVLMGHLADLAVKAGQDVAPGTILGHAGSTYGAGGYSSGIHTHFEVRQGGKAIDPTRWLLQAASISGQATASAADPAGIAVKQFLDHISFKSHDPCSPPADEGGVILILDWVMCPRNWWRVGFLVAGVTIFMIGFHVYFVKEEIQVVERAAPLAAEAS